MTYQKLFSVSWVRGLASIVLLLCAIPVFAETGHPLPWQIDFQPPATPVMYQLKEFHDLLFIIICCIGAFVVFLVFFVVWRFRASKNPTPSKRTHNTMLEAVWTLVPVLILLGIAYPSFRLLYYMDVAPNADLTIKAVGHQWYWSYEYPDHGNFEFDSYIVPDKELKPDQLRLLSVDNPVYVPVGKNVRLLTTSTDVIHSWAVPSFGVKKDSVPGRINETWFRAEKPGVYYGQCSELCGPKHGFMPIEVRAIPEEEFNAWAKKARVEFG